MTRKNVQLRGILAAVTTPFTDDGSQVDEAALRACLARLAGDRATAKQMGARAREVALSRYSAERMLDDYLALYEQALAR